MMQNQVREREDHAAPDRMRERENERMRQRRVREMVVKRVLWDRAMEGGVPPR